MAERSTGEYGEARAVHERAMALRRDLRDRRGESASLGNLGLVQDCLGDLAGAADLHGRSLALDRSAGDRRAEAQSLGNAGHVVFGLGRYEEAAP